MHPGCDAADVDLGVEVCEEGGGSGGGEEHGEVSAALEVEVVEGERGVAFLEGQGCGGGGGGGGRGYWDGGRGCDDGREEDEDGEPFLWTRQAHCSE